MKRTQLRSTLIGVVVIALLGTMAFTLQARKDRRSNVAVLPDGTRLEFLKLVSGTATFTTDSRLQQFLRRHLPARLAQRLPSVTAATCSSSTNSATAFFKLSSPNGALPAVVPWVEYVTEDSTGLQYNTGASYCSFGGSSSNRFYGLLLMAYPRRDPTFALRLLDNSKKVIASFVLQNPSGTKWPIWKPSPMPQTTTNGPVILTLRGLQQEGFAQRQWVKPDWSLAATDPQWIHAEPRLTFMEDATGNQASMLSRSEPAWKLSTLVYRKRGEDFGPADELELPNLHAPGPEGFTEFDQSGTAAGVVIRVKGWAKAGELFMTNGTSFGYVERKDGAGDSSSSSTTTGTTLYTWSRPYPFLLVQTFGMQPDDELHFVRLDQNGAEEADEVTGECSGYAGGRVYTLKVPPLPASTSRSFRIRISRPLRFEFMVDPRDVKRPLRAP